MLDLLHDFPIAPQVLSPSPWGSHFLAMLPSTPRIRSSPLLVFLLILAAAFWLIQLLRSVCNLFSYWDIQVFYREALHIPPVSWVGVSVWRGAMSWGRVRGGVGAVRTEGPIGKLAEGLIDTNSRPRIILGGTTTYKARSPL